jgi:DNA polymerase-1
MMPYEAMVGKGKKELPITEVPIRKLAFYAAEDADYTWRLYEVLLPRVSKAGLDETLKLEVDLIPVLAGMEIAGVIVDVPFLQNMSKELAKDIQSLEKKIYKLAGMEFNIASPKQLKEVLFDKLKIDTQGLAKTKTGISTAASELDKMRGLHPIIDLISDYDIEDDIEEIKKYIPKALANTLKLAEIVGMTEEEIIHAIEEKYKVKVG